MIHTANQNVPTFLGMIFANMGLMLNPTEVNILAALVTAGAGVVTVMITFYNAIVKRRIMQKNEIKTDLEIRKAQAELILLEQEVQDHKKSENNRKNAKRV